MRLYNILRTYSVYDDQVGYCQGMNFVAGTLLTHVHVLPVISALTLSIEHKRTECLQSIEQTDAYL